MKKKKILMLIGSVCLSLVLAALLLPACAPAVPEAEEVAELEAELAAEKAKTEELESEVSDLEDDLAVLKRPAKVYRWEPSTWSPAGSCWNNLIYMSEYLDKMSDGRIVMTPSPPGGVCPVEEQADAVSAGTTAAMAITPPYYPGKIPVAYMASTIFTLRYVHELIDLLEIFEGGRANEIWEQEIEKLYNIEQIGRCYLPMDMIISSTVPINGIADLKGVKFRCGDANIADPLIYFGAATVWFPGTEIYTGVATGVVDAFTYGSAYDHHLNSFHEVTQYWVSEPLMFAPAADSFVVNRDVWNEMPEDLQEMVKVAIDAATNRVVAEGYAYLDDTWLTVKEYGIEVIEWPEADQKEFKSRQLELARKFSDDPAYLELMEIIERFSKMKGHIE